MGYIKNIGDLIEHYHDLYAFWTREVARLIFFNYLDYSNAQLTEKEKYIINGLEQYGFESFAEEYQNLCTLNSKTTNSIKTAKVKRINPFVKFWMNTMTANVQYV